MVSKIKMMKVRDFISKLNELGFDDDTDIEFEMTDYENSYIYPELEIEEVNTIEQDIDINSKPNILVSLKY